jgi:hypothetical protein
MQKWPRMYWRLPAAALLIVLASAAGYFAARKLIHHFRPRPLMMAGQDHSVTPYPNAYRDENPLEPAIQSALKGLRSSGPQLAPTGLDRTKYLRLAAGIIDHFSPFQQQNGEIDDPYERTEIQYSTPSYALAAAILVESGTRPDLLSKASRALDRSLSELATHSAANQTGDFFIFPAMSAYARLRDRVDPATRERWQGYLRKIDPDLAYSDRIGPGQPDVMNWNSNAILGEFLRFKEGFTDQKFVSRYLDAQLPRFTPEGLYRDPGTPLVYDAAARFNFLLLLNEGYRGPHRAALETLLHRGAWASLLMQSPTGDFPSGGRSSGHVWNDALECANFELWARRSAVAGDMTGARAFKRAAHLAAQSIARWVRPTGDIWIVKNRFDPELRHGYEDYSFHSQYNLLTAAYLALAWSYADESVPEGPSPAETGNFLVNLPNFHKIFANVSGHYLEIDLAGEEKHGETGLIRLDGAIPPGGNSVIIGGGTAIGSGWKVGGKVEYLARVPSDRIIARLASLKRSDRELQFSVHYTLKGANVRGVTETYTLRPDTLQVRADVEGKVDRLFVRYPALVRNGRDKPTVNAKASAITIRLDRSTQTFEVLPPKADLHNTGVVVSDRYGLYKYFEAAVPGPVLTFQMSSR